MKKVLTGSLDEELEVQLDGLGTVSQSGVVDATIAGLDLVNGQEVVEGVLASLLALDPGGGCGVKINRLELKEIFGPKTVETQLLDAFPKVIMCSIRRISYL